MAHTLPRGAFAGLTDELSAATAPETTPRPNPPSTRSAPPAPSKPVGVERDQAEAIAGAVAAQAFTRADLEPLATKAEFRTLQWVVGIQSAITLATFAIVVAKLL